MFDAILKKPACTLLACYYIIVLLVPNVALCVTESLGAASAVVNMLVPAGLYILLLSLFHRTGWAVLCMLPFSILAAFQIVLLFLYGGSIIAVDMFLNVVTTNMSEVTELLANLGTAIAVVVLLYLPPIVWAIVSLVRGKVLRKEIAKVMRYAGVVILVTGLLTGCVWAHADNSYNMHREVFPINVLHNIVIAIDRTTDVKNYSRTSELFKYNSTSMHRAEDREVYVMVIGETSRAVNWQLCGYSRPTNKCLSSREGVVFNRKAFSESNTTHKSVPMLMSGVTASDFDSIGRVKSVITAFREAGYRTMFVSNQAPNHSYTQFFGEEADRVVYVPDSLGHHPYDDEMLVEVERALADTLYNKHFIVLHSYGSHFKYMERYPSGYGSFKPDECSEVTEESRQVLINAYDNTIEYTDMWLDRLMGMIEATGWKGAVVYSSDHGEDILDDSRKRFLHASPTPTYYQLHVAMLSWLSSSYIDEYPDKYKHLVNHKNSSVSSTASLFNTLLDIAGIETKYLNRSLSLANDSYKRTNPLYLNDMNEGVSIEECGLDKLDWDILNESDVLE